MGVRKRTLVTALLVSAVVAAACGGGEDDAGQETETAAEPTAEETTSAPASEPSSDGTGTEAALAGGCDVWGDNVSLTIGGGASGGAYFIIGAELAEIINDELECVTASSSSGTSAEFIRGGLDIVLTIGDNAYAAWSGEGGQGFEEGEQYDYRYLASGHNSEFLYVVPADSDKQAFSDFGAGDTLGVSAPTLVPHNRDLFDAYGATETQIDILQGYDQLLTALRQGQFDVVEIGTAHPTSALIEGQESQELRAIYHDPAVLQEFKDSHDFIGSGLVKGDTYNFLDGDYETYGRRMQIIVKSDLQDELAYAVLQAMSDNADRFKAALQQGDQYTLQTSVEAMEEATVRLPLHPGAIAFYEDQGVTIPDSIPAPDTTPPGA